jgi:hypothetical protein
VVSGAPRRDDGEGVAEFLVEVYVADHARARQIRRAAQATEGAAGEVTNGSASTSCLRSIFVPEDETCFLLYEAPSVDAVQDEVARIGIRPEHISAAES